MKRMWYRIVRHWYHLFLASAGVLFFLSWYIPYVNPPVVVHGSDLVVRGPIQGRMQTDVQLVMQYKSNEGGFVAGEPIQVFLALKMSPTAYQDFDGLFKDIDRTNITLAEAIELHGVDLSNKYRQYGIDSVFVYEATLALKSKNATNRSAIFEGDVIFTDAGEIRIGAPLNYFLEKYDLRPRVLTIAPRYVQYEINASKRVESVAFAGLALACLAVFFQVREQKRKKA